MIIRDKQCKEYLFQDLHHYLGISKNDPMGGLGGVGEGLGGVEYVFSK